MEKPYKRISTSTVITIISMSLVLFLVGMLGVFFITAKKIKDYVQENIGFTVYFKDNVKEDAIERLSNYFKASSYVKSARFIHQDSAAAEFEKEIGEEFIKFIGTNPIHHSFEVKLKASYANPDSIQWINKQISDFSFVEEFRYHETFLKEVSDNTRYIAFALGIIAIIMLLISFVLINNTIRLAIYSKRFLIKTMQLVGATSSFIRKPFLINGIKHGIISAFIANLILWAGIFISEKKIPDLKGIVDQHMQIFLFAVIFLFGILISGLSTFFAVRKYLRLSSEELYY